MNKEFIPYEQALALKELGFDEPCFGYYPNNEFQFFADVRSCNTNSEFGFYPTAPTYSQAFQWFREKYNLIPAMQSIVDEKVGLRFYYSIEKYGDNWEDIVPNSELYTKYGKAELACLIKLIEIVKNK
jgi:hypothetical protein